MNEIKEKNEVTTEATELEKLRQDLLAQKAKNETNSAIVMKIFIVAVCLSIIAFLNLDILGSISRQINAINATATLIPYNPILVTSTTDPYWTPNAVQQKSIISGNIEPMAAPIPIENLPNRDQ
jgi:hypothetical protein